MSRRRLSCLLLFGFLVSSPGCALMEPMHSVSNHMFGMFKPNPRGYRDYTEDYVDEFATVGQEARGDVALQKDDEDIYNRIFKSSKHRAIEQNLGFRH